MYKLLLIISFALTVISSDLVAEDLVVQVEGSAVKTASLPAHVYEARAIADALHSVVQSGAQSLGSFSLVENGKVLFDQISAQSNIKIAGYRVLSIKDYGDKVSAKLEVLLLPSGNGKKSPTCRQPTNLDIALKWQGVFSKKTIPFWMQIDEQSVLSRITQQINADGKFNTFGKVSVQDEDQSSYSLYETKSVTTTSNPKYTISLKIILDTKNNSNFLHQSKNLIIKIQSDLIRRLQIINSAELQADFRIENIILNNNISSGRRNLDNLQIEIAKLAELAVAKSLEKLECKNIISKIKYKNESLEIDYGYRDGLLETDIFSAYGTETKQYYFTVKKMGDNSTTLHALSQNTNIKVYDGLNIQLLERF